MLSENVISDNLKHYIRQAGINGNRLSIASGVPAARISDLLRGNTKDPRLMTMIKLADALGVKVDDLIKPISDPH